jgi:hypothetical protein
LLSALLRLLLEVIIFIVIFRDSLLFNDAAGFALLLALRRLDGCCDRAVVLLERVFFRLLCILLLDGGLRLLLPTGCATSGDY